MYTGSLQVLAGNIRNGKILYPFRGQAEKKLYEM